MEKKRTCKKEDNRKVKWKKTVKVLIFLVSLFTLFLCAAGGTAAFITTKTNSIENRFQAAKITCEVDEEFDRNKKSSIIVRNTGTASAYVRVRLVSYRVDGTEENMHLIGGQAEISSFQCRTEDWMEAGNGIYYYKYPINSPESPVYRDETSNLIADGDEICLESYSDADGGKQVIEVIAEAIQSNPIDAVKDAWPEEVVSWLSVDGKQKTADNINGDQEVQR